MSERSRLPKFLREKDELRTNLDSWLYLLRHGDELDAGNLPAALSTPLLRRAVEELAMFNQNEVERERYKARLKHLRDERGRLKFATEEGLSLGLQEGLERGRLQGQTAALEDALGCRRPRKRSWTPRLSNICSSAWRT